MQNTLVGNSEKPISKQSKCSDNLHNLDVTESLHKKNLPSNQELCCVHRNAKHRNRIQNLTTMIRTMHLHYELHNESKSTQLL